MYSRNEGGRKRYLRILGLLLVLPLVHPVMIPAQEFGASVPPKGHFSLKVFPKAFFTNAYFSDKGKALNSLDFTGLLYLEVPVQVQYGLTGSVAIGTIVPFGWTYQEVHPDIREDAVHRFAVREFWLTLQHRWWTFLFYSSSSLRVKIPLADKKPWEDGLRIGDGQIDVYPEYHFDYFDETRYLFARFTIGYKYRFKSGQTKPFDELNFKSTLGLELWDRPKLDLFLYADLTQFRNGDYGETEREFFEEEGSLHTLGYGVSLAPFPWMQIYLDTAGDFSGRNRYRGMRWTLGFRRVFRSLSGLFSDRPASGHPFPTSNP